MSKDVGDLRRGLIRDQLYRLGDLTKTHPLLALIGFVFTVYGGLVSLNVFPPPIGPNGIFELLAKMKALYFSNPKEQALLCDQLASDPDDLARRKLGLFGVRTIKAPELAEVICSAALQPNFKAQLLHEQARALEANHKTREAQEEYKKASAMGYPPAITKFAERLLHQSADCTAAFDLFKKALSGSAAAMYWIGLAEYEGSYEMCGVLRDKDQGAHLLLDASEYGNPNASALIKAYKLTASPAQSSVR